MVILSPFLYIPSLYNVSNIDTLFNEDSLCFVGVTIKRILNHVVLEFFPSRYLQVVPTSVDFRDNPTYKFYR